MNKMFTLSDFVKSKCIGTGGFGTVYLCKHPVYKTCVLKEIHAEAAQDEEISKVFKEACILSSLSHPNVIRYLSHAHANKTLYIVMEHAQHGDLHKYISSMTEDPPEDRVIQLFGQVVCGVAYIHEKGIIHRDISARNILICRGEVLKISDFGLSRKLESISSGVVGNPSNFAPELCWGGHATQASDVWALGCLLHHLATRHPPYSAPSLAATVRHIVSSNTPSLPSNFSKGLQQLHNDMLKKSPTDRPTAEHLLSHPCLAIVVHVVAPKPRTLCPLQETLDALGFNVW